MSGAHSQALRDLIVRSLSIALVLALAHAADAVAGEGVREINQVSASGGPAELHIISAPGSYRLTGDLVVPAGLDGIRIDVSDVTLDLNGFTISSQGTGGLAVHGITGATLTNVEIRNGTIRGFPTSGVHLPSGLMHRVIDVRVIGNGNFGINMIGNDSFGGHLIRGCMAFGNGTGMRVEPPGSLVVDSVARGNQFGGLQLGSVGYARNTLSGNGTDLAGGVSLGCNLIGGSQVCPP
jgi:hypothetical protein